MKVKVVKDRERMEIRERKGREGGKVDVRNEKE